MIARPCTVPHSTGQLFGPKVFCAPKIYGALNEKTGSLVGWLVGWLVGCLVGCLVGWLVGWFVGCSFNPLY